MPSALLSAPAQATARLSWPHRVFAFAQGLSAHRAGHPLFPTVCRQDATSSRSIGRHVLEIQGQRIDLVVVAAYGDSNELVAEFDGPRLVVENVDPAIDKKTEVFLETLFLVAAADGPELDLNPFSASIAYNPGPDARSSIKTFSTRCLSRSHTTASRISTGSKRALTTSTT